MAAEARSPPTRLSNSIARRTARPRQRHVYLEPFGVEGRADETNTPSDDTRGLDRPALTDARNLLGPPSGTSYRVSIVRH